MDISPARLVGFEERARARLTRFGAAGGADGGADEGELLRRNVLGVAGEQAVLDLIRSLMGDRFEIRDAADAPDGHSDLELTTEAGTLGIEVKTTTYGVWLRHGRSIPEDQLYETDAAIYVWCAGPQTLKPEQVHIVGWSTTADIQRDCSDQRYAGHRDGFMRQHGISATSPDPDLSYPQYGLDDPGFDDHEWHQTAGLREQPADFELRDISCPTGQPDALSALLAAPEWREGTAPRPGFGPGKAIVRANATVRPIATLADWISQWDPKNQDLEGHAG